MNFPTLATATVIILAASAPALAQDGMASLHSQARIGGKVCMTSHFHNGQSTNAPSRKAAEMAAVRDWSSFTAWEYGGAWANFQLAAAKSMKCSQAGNTWGCNVEARPCRR
jgi:hypothetical protein